MRFTPGQLASQYYDLWAVFLQAGAGACLFKRWRLGPDGHAKLGGLALTPVYLTVFRADKRRFADTGHRGDLFIGMRAE